MRIFRNVLFAVIGLAVFASCSSDDDDKVIPEGDKSTVQVVLRSTMSDEVVTFEANNDANPLKLEQLFINIAEIEFDVADDKVYSDVELKGPFPIDLLSEKAANGWTLSTTTVPNGTYEEIEFEFDVYKGGDDKLANLKGNTIYASGSFDLGEAVIPFIIKSDKEMEVELEYENKPLILDGENAKVFIELNLNKVVSELIKNAATDFVSAKIEDDGSILIDKNTNKTILEKFEDALEKTFEAIEDAHEKDN